jgi:tetratricopeptide (TPR) repeat protein
VYVDSANESVGEAVVSSQPAANEAPTSALSIPAQRYLELGDRAFREERYTDAVQFYAKAVEFAPDQGALYLVLADALFAAGDYHYAAYAVRRAIELEPALIDAQVDKRGFYPDPKRFDEHLAALERYLADHPGDRDARLVLALNYLFSSRAKDAVRILEQGPPAMDDQAGQRLFERSRAAGSSPTER